MKRLEGIEADESVIQRIRCTYKNHWGDLVLTNKRILFLKIKGILGQGREQLHQFNFDDVVRIQTKKKKAGIFRQGLVIDHQAESAQKRSYYYACEEHKAVLFLAFYERQKLLPMTTKETSFTIRSLSTYKRNADLLKVAKNPKMRPYFFSYALEKIEEDILGLLIHRFDADLFETASERRIISRIALLHESESRKVPRDQVYKTVVDVVSYLTDKGALDGIVTDVGKYVSNRALARVTVPFEMISDFQTIFSQLHEKGLDIWAIDCPSCFRKIEFPKAGKETTCQFCDATIHAREVLEKFADLL
ncbi:MAG: hypothetical protein ACFFE2_11480 [Candidatus Thorarchaeota archaeon]